MNVQRSSTRESRLLKTLLSARSMRMVTVLSPLALLLSPPLFADEPPATPVSPKHDHAQRQSMEEHAGNARSRQSMPMSSMDMASMQGGVAPSDARDPNAYADGYEYTNMPGMEQSDQIAVSKMFPEQLEFVRGDDGDGFAWDVQTSYGGDEQKLWLRTEGSAAGGSVGPTTSAEALWWRAFSPFWATQFGVRQDFGAGAHTYLAFGVQGIAPYWFALEATGYLAEDGRLGARLKASYDLLFTNRLILTPNLESNINSKAERERSVGSGVGNLEIGLRLRYEFSRKFAPYLGYVWDRAYGGIADRLRAEGKEVTDNQIVAGVRVWW